MFRNTTALLLAIGLAACTSAAGSGSAFPDPALPPSNPNSQGTTDTVTLREYPVADGAHPHDVAPAADGGVWYTAQNHGQLGWLDPETGNTEVINLGVGSSPHGVIVGPDGAAWVTDSGLNAIVRVDGQTREITYFNLPDDRAGSNLNTAAFDTTGILWFTGQNGIIGRLDPSNGNMQVFDAPRGRGPYGITTTGDGGVYFASLAGSYLGQVDPVGFGITVIEPSSPDAGVRRAWADSQGRVWISEWNAGNVGMYDPSRDNLQEWHLPSPAAQAYAIYVDERDIVWLSDFGSNSIMRFDPVSQTFESYPLPSENAAVRQLLGRPGEIWGAESAVDKLVVLLISP